MSRGSSRAAGGTALLELSQIGREAGALARQGHLILLRRAVPSFARPASISRPRAAAARVVVFVHGYLALAPVFDPLRALVESRLGLETLGVDYSPFERFEDVARRVAAVVDAIPASREVDVIGHSLGGIVSRWFLQELGGASRVRRLVTIASPHAGTRAAQHISLGSLTTAIRPDSPVISALRRHRARAASVLHTAIVAGADRLVTPPQSAAALEDAEVHWFDDLGHNAVLYDPRVHARVIESLAPSTR